jgi:predicted NBD/HSP70 family sugar kinase
MLRRYKNPGDVTGRDVVEWATAADPIALEVIEKSGRYFGLGLAVLIDVLNPELIVVGSMGVRLGERLFAPAREVITQEALPGAAAVCRIVPAALGERIGDFAALCVALEGEAGRRERGGEVPREGRDEAPSALRRTGRKRPPAVRGATARRARPEPVRAVRPSDGEDGWGSRQNKERA